MEHGFLWLNFITGPLTEFFNHLFNTADPATSSFFRDSNNYNQVVYMWLYMLFLTLMGFLATRAIKMVPGALQNFMEVVVDGLRGLLIDNMGPHGMIFFPLIATIAVFIFTANMAGIIPGFFSPTANMNTNAAMALTVFVLTHIVGVRIHGFKYLKQFMGPVWWMAPIMIPIELIGHLARPLSLTMRLFGNIAGEDLVLGVLLLLVPYVVPLPFLALMIFTSVLQAFVFSLLAMMYISGAMEEAH
ncbi:MAG TPA: F0F1 ATP synthase subunit A [Desulfomonilia bacterium]|jgi:F-type H+-transporting ATPase subunit a